MSLRPALAALLGAVVLHVASPTMQTPAPQQAPPQQVQPPVFRSGADLVRVDVTVLDNKGQPVKDLRAEDFHVEEDGAAQTIRSFDRIDFLAGSTDGRNLEITSQAQGDQEFAREDVRAFLIFWDEYHIPQQYQSQMLRDALVKFLRTMVAPTDVIAIMDPWTPMSDLRWTRDRASLWTRTISLKGRQGVYTPTRNIAEENHLREFGRIEYLRSQVAISALQSAMMHLGAKREGRKAVVYFGREFGVGDRTEQFRTTAEMIQVANDANVALYSVNPDGLTMRGMRSGILTDIARESGGEAMVTNAPELSLRRAVQQSSAVYLLGYSPSPLRRDGKFHKIRVNVKRGGMHVRARNGYWAPDDKTIALAKAATAAAVLPTGIEAALAELARLDRHDGDDPLALPAIIEPTDPSPLLAVNAPRLWVVKRPPDLKAVMSESPPEPAVQREFVRTDRVIARIDIAGTQAADAQVVAALVDRRGKRLLELPLRPSGSGWLLDLPFASIARGDYVLTLEARAGDTRSTAYVPIRVKP